MEQTFHAQLTFYPAAVPPRSILDQLLTLQVCPTLGLKTLVYLRTQTLQWGAEVEPEHRTDQALDRASVVTVTQPEAPWGLQNQTRQLQTKFRHNFKICLLFESNLDDLVKRILQHYPIRIVDKTRWVAMAYLDLCILVMKISLTVI